MKSSRFAHTAGVEVPLEQPPKQLRAVGLKQALDLGVSHSSRLLTVEPDDETFEMLAGGTERIGFDDGVCFHGVGASGVMYGLRNRIRTPPRPFLSTLPTPISAASHDHAVVLTDLHPCDMASAY